MAGLQVPHIEEQRVDARARAEGREALTRLSPTHLTNLIAWQKQESDDHNKELRSLWSYWWDLWLNHVDYGDKEDWQTQLWVPKPFAATEQATALIQRSLLDSDEPFGVEGHDEASKLLALHYWNPLIRLAFDQAHFVGKYTDSVKVGFILGVAGYLKFRWQRTRTPQLVGATLDPTTQELLPNFTFRSTSFLAIDYVLPWHIHRDPASRPRENFSGNYLIHDEWKSRADLAQMVRAGWDERAVRELLALRGQSASDATIGSGTSLQQDAARKQQAYAPSTLRQPYLIDEWWGDVLDENGDPVYPDAMMIQSNTRLLYGPTDNPLWATDVDAGRRKWPFIAAAPIMHPSRFEGRGIAEQNAALARLFSGTLCLTADGMNWAVNPEREIWQDALTDATDLDHFPGKLWIKKDQRQALMKAQGTDIPLGEIMAFLQFVSQLAKESDFVTDFAAGLPGSRTDITKGEVVIKTQQSLALFEGVGKNLEAGGRECVAMAKDFLQQYLWDFTEPSVMSLLGPEKAMMLQTWPMHERFNQLQGNFTYKFTGITQAMQKAEQINKIVQFGQLAASMPYVALVGQRAPQAFLEILTALRDLLGLSDRITLPSAQEAMAPAAPAPAGPGAGVVPNTPEALLAAAAAQAQGAGRAATVPPTQDQAAAMGR